MKHEIRFKGLSLDRDELAAQHGELALCGGVELHDGALRPSELNGTPLGGGDALPGTLLYVHINASYKHYIYWTPSPSKLWWAEETVNNNVTSWSTHDIANFFPLQDIVSINSVGNTLCVFTTEGIHYILFKEDDYKYLGQQPPFLELQFNMHPVNTVDDEVKNKIDIEAEFGIPGVSGGFISENGGDDWIQYDQSQTGTGGWVIRDEFQAPITESVMAAANKLISDASDAGLFHAPFFIRYCYKMHDGTSLIRHSPPVLMMPALSDEITAEVKDFYRVAIANQQYKNYTSKFTCYIEIITAKLQAKCLDTAVISSLVEWKDIIKSLDIYITPQITRIDSASLISFIKNTYQARLGKGLLDGNYRTINCERHFRQEGEGTDLITYNQGSLSLPKCTEAEYKEKVRNTSTFYKLASYKLESLQSAFSSSFSDLELENNILKNIVVQNQMTDDYKTHNILVPMESGRGGLYVYNHRLNVFGISERLFEGFSPSVLFPYVDSTHADGNITKVIITLKTEDGLKKVEKTCNSPFIANALADFAFYPDARANGIIFVYGEEDYNQKKYKLEEHMSLNGAFYSFANQSFFSANDGNNLVAMPSKIYTSKMDNPFYFPNLVGDSGINSVGTGIILGLAIVTRALSPSQVGDHDLIIFSTDGIWVAKVSATGTYSSLHNISNEVCIHPKSICQLGQSVIFATNRSLSRFYESDVISISDMLNGPIKNFTTMMPAFCGLFDSGGALENANIKKLLEFNTGAIDYFSKGSVIYDYESKRLIILPENISLTTNVALVFSITDQAWSTMIIPPLITIIPGYPCPFYQLGNSSDRGKVFVLDKPYPQESGVEATQYKGVIVTRTLVFSETQDVIQGFQQLCDCENMPLMYIYGSNDQKNWVNIGYSNRPYANYLPGHPYRYFRIAMYISMIDTERYQELILDVINKYTKL